MLTIQRKVEFEQFIQTCTPLVKIPELEQFMRQRVHKIVADLLNFQPGSDSITSLRSFLQRDENFLGVLLALTNLSQEKFLRILTAQRFASGDFDPEWGPDSVYNRLKKDDSFATSIARLFLEGRDNHLLAQQVADFYLDQLSLPSHWQEIIRDENLIGNVVRKKLTGEYSDQKGEFVEKMIRQQLDQIEQKYGVGYQHGQVEFVGKEIDYAIPTLQTPLVMIMSSYMETTSSSQTARANEQQAVYEKIIGANVRYAPLRRVFVNVIDGAGWLARRSDLRKMHAGCDYCLSLQMLDQLEAIICRYVPAQHFRDRNKPATEER